MRREGRRKENVKVRKRLLGRTFACACGHGGMGYNGNFHFLFHIFKISDSVFIG